MVCLGRGTGKSPGAFREMKVFFTCHLPPEEQTLVVEAGLSINSHYLKPVVCTYS